MRIAINAAYLNPGAHDGIANVGRGVIKSLSQLDDEIILYAPESIECEAGGKVLHRPTPKRLTVRTGPVGGFMRVGIWSQTVLPYRALRDRADVVLSPVPEGVFFRAVPQVVMVHDLFPFIFPDLFGPWRHYFAHGLPRVLNACARIIATVGQAKIEMVNRLHIPEEKIEVVHLGINPIFFSDDPGTAPNGYEEGPYFLFVGRCDPHKNIEAVWQAYAAIHQSVPHKLAVVLDFYGKHGNPYYEQLLKEAATLGFADKLRVFSGLQLRELLFMYRHATALILLPKYEGFGLPPIEAMAVGTPAIVSNTTGPGEVAGPGAICVPPDEPLRAAEAMRELASNQEYWTRCSQTAAKHASQFTWERTARRIRSVLASVAR